eukprot:Amastigsp_a174468_31.p4 type:complete len:104 gc:universal Amastigsp_a174468_31:1415-1104(-)
MASIDFDLRDGMRRFTSRFLRSFSLSLSSSGSSSASGGISFVDLVVRRRTLCDRRTRAPSSPEDAASEAPVRGAAAPAEPAVSLAECAVDVPTLLTITVWCST